MTRAYRDRVAQVFRDRPHVWIDGLEMAQVGGCYASRTRISECRTQLGMRIENKVVRSKGGMARSCYRYVPASEPRQANLLERAS